MASVLERHPHPKYPRLSIQLRSDSKFYQTVTYIDGKLRQASTKAANLPTAIKIGEVWYRKLLRASANEARRHPLDKLGTDPTVGEVFSRYLATLPQSKKDYANMKWSTIADFWRTIEVADVTPQTFRDFFAWRRRRKTPQGTRIKNHSLHKDVMVIRQVLTHAIEDGHLTHLPHIPKVGKIEANPRPWLTPDEWQHLSDVSAQRIADSIDNLRLHDQRLELHDFMIFMVSTGCRVGEALAVRFKDCRIVAQKDKRNRLLVSLTGKRGTRTSVSTHEAAKVVKDRANARRLTLESPELVFPVHHRDAFRELLIAANLRTDDAGFPRNLKSLRATGISFRLLEPNPNLLAIARNVGTSLAMIDNFYAKRLTAEMHQDSLSTSLGVAGYSLS